MTTLTSSQSLGVLPQTATTLANAGSAVAVAAVATKDKVGSVAGSALSLVGSATSGVANVAVSTVQTVGGAAGTVISTVGGAVPHGLVALDTVLDLVPFGSAANNLVDLGLKHLVIKDMDPNSSAFKAYIEHLQKKDSKACLAYSVPFVGNVFKLGTIVYGLVTGKKEEASASSEGGLPPYLENMEGTSTLGERLLGAYHEPGDELHRDPLALAGRINPEGYTDFTQFPSERA